MSIHQSELQTSVGSVLRSTLKVGDKVIEGFAVVYLQRIGDKTVTTSYDKKGDFIASHKAEWRYIRRATEGNLKVVADYEFYEKEYEKMKRAYRAQISQLTKRFE
jgi:hypothetical protein